MAVTIAIMSYKELTSLIRRVNYQPPEGVALKIVDALLEEALDVAKSMEESGEADAFVSAGANLSLLSAQLKTPLVGIAVTGFDLLLALAKVKGSRRAGIITYAHTLPYLDQIAGTITVTLHQKTFHGIGQLDGVLDELLDQGVTNVIGGSLVSERARRKKMHDIFMYSEDGVCRALDAAVKIALAKKAEAEKAETLRTIINFAHEGIIATDKEGIVTVFNPSAEKIMRISGSSVLGHPVSEVIPSTRLHHVLADGESELSQIQSVGDAKIVTNRIPIITRGKITGAVATFQDVGDIQRAEEKIRKRLYEKGFVAKNTFADIAERSKGIAEIKQEARRYAKTESTILILGESGTGKDMFAQAIHNESFRKKHPFVTINCAALPDSLLESELFGYDEGAFTGAKKGGKAGLFELAHSGSIFLDEIGEMPLEIQSRLLRVLQEHEVLRIGGERILPVDIRVIAATNKNLWQMVQAGEFREDLYYRVSVLELQIPPLRDRPEDIGHLAAKFLREFRPDLPGDVVAKLAETPRLANCQWPGNTRQLRNVVERLSVLYDRQADHDKLVRMVLGENMVQRLPKTEKERAAQVIADCGGNKTAAAEKMGISRTTLWRKLREWS